MKVGKSVKKAIDDWVADDLDSAMLHACNAVDGTARKVYPNLRVGDRFTRLLRENYPILGPMGIPGVNITETRFPVKMKQPTAPGGYPDLADIIYGVHRCTHGHGDELPEGFELIANLKGPVRFTRIAVTKGGVQLSDRIIAGLLAVAVMSPANVDQSVPGSYLLTYGTIELRINEWWGRATDFPSVVTQDPVGSTKLDFTDWMDEQ